MAQLAPARARRSGYGRSLGPRGGGTTRKRAPDAFRLGSAGVIACLVVFGLLVPRLAAARWIALAAVVTWALCALLGEILGPGAGRPVAGASTGVDTIAIGWAVAAALHLVAGSPLGLPSAEDVTRGIADLRVTVQGVMRAPHQVWGVEKFSGQDAEGNVIELPVYGRDATGARAVAKLRRFCFTGTPGSPVPACRKTRP